MSNDNKSLFDAVDRHIKYRLHQMHTAMPAQVTAYDEVTNTCFAKPMIQTPILDDDDDPAYEDWEEIPFVPVCFPRAGDYVITFPLAVGDTVLLVFSEGSTAEWHDANASTQPFDLRRFSAGYPFAIPGAYPGGAKPLSSDPIDRAARTGGIVIGQHNGENRIEISSSGIKLGKSAVDFVAMSAKVDAIFSSLKTYASAVGTCFGTIPAPCVPTGLTTYTAAQAAFNATVQTVAAAETKAK